MTAQSRLQGASAGAPGPSAISSGPDVRERGGAARGGIEVEPRIDAEGRSVVEKAAARSLRLGQDAVRLLEAELGESRRQQVPGFGGDRAHVLDPVRRLRMKL